LDSFLVRRIIIVLSFNNCNIFLQRLKALVIEELVGG